jgi:hypothetical protein
MTHDADDLRRHFTPTQIVMKRHLPQRLTSRRGAILTMELVLVLPLFLLLLFSIVEFSMLASARQRVSDAARTGVRKICLANASEESVRSEVVRALGPALAQNITIYVTRPDRQGEIANVRIAVPMNNATPNLLWIAGFNVNQRYLVADAPMVREHDTVSVGHHDSEQL